MRKSAPRRHSKVVGADGSYDWSSSPAMLDDGRQSPWTFGRTPPEMYRSKSSFDVSALPGREWLDGAMKALEGWWDRSGLSQTAKSVSDWWGGLSRTGARAGEEAAGAQAARANYRPPEAYSQRPAQPAQASAAPVAPGHLMADPGQAAEAPSGAYDTFWYTPARQVIAANRARLLAEGDEEGAKRWDMGLLDRMAAHQGAAAAGGTPVRYGIEPNQAVVPGVDYGRYGPEARTAPAGLPFDVSKPLDEVQRELYLADLSARHGAHVGLADMARYNGGLEFDPDGNLRPYAEARGAWLDRRFPGANREELAGQGIQLGPMGSVYAPDLGGEGHRDFVTAVMFPYLQAGYDPRQAYDMARNRLVADGVLYLPGEEGWKSWSSGWSPRDMALFNGVAEHGRSARFSDPGSSNYLSLYLGDPLFGAMRYAALDPAVMGLAGAAGNVAGQKAVLPAAFAAHLAGSYGTAWGLGAAGRAASSLGPAGSSLASAASGGAKALRGLGRRAVLLNNLYEAGSELADTGRAADLHAVMTGGRRTGVADRHFREVAEARRLARNKPGVPVYSDLLAGSVTRPALQGISVLDQLLNAPADKEIRELTTQGSRNERLLGRLLEMWDDSRLGGHAREQFYSMLSPETAAILRADPGDLDPEDLEGRMRLENALKSFDFSNPLQRDRLIRQLRRSGLLADTGE